MSSLTSLSTTAALELPPHSRWSRWVVGVGIALVIGVWMVNRPPFSLAALVAREAGFRATYLQHSIAVPSVAFVLYVALTALSIPGTSLLTLAAGWLFGFWPALVLVSCASSVGATLSCGLSRTLFRDAAAHRLGSRLRVIEESLARDGDFYLLTLRLLPQVPSFLINLAMGLTRYPLWRFYWISQLGMLPATCVFVYAGSQAADLKTLVEQGPGSLLTPKLIAALYLLALLPWGLRSIVRWIRPLVGDSVVEALRATTNETMLSVKSETRQTDVCGSLRFEDFGSRLNGGSDER